MNHINSEKINQWNSSGYIHLRNYFDNAESANIKIWSDEIINNSSPKWMNHFEYINGKPNLCRTEDFVPYHNQFKKLLTDGKIYKLLSQLFNEEVVLYKEKINYKLPGGAGYSPHQDAVAYPFIKKHATCLIPIDDSNESNGCIYFSPWPYNDNLLEIDPKNGCIPESISKELKWIPCEAKNGDLVIFSSYTPHFSNKNFSNFSRRALYATYNSLNEGDMRDEYYVKKKKKLSDNSSRISIIGHFQGQTT